MFNTAPSADLEAAYMCTRKKISALILLTAFLGLICINFTGCAELREARRNDARIEAWAEENVIERAEDYLLEKYGEKLVADEYYLCTNSGLFITKYSGDVVVRILDGSDSFCVMVDADDEGKTVFDNRQKEEIKAALINEIKADYNLPKNGVYDIDYTTKNAWYVIENEWDVSGMAAFLYEGQTGTELYSNFVDIDFFGNFAQENFLESIKINDTDDICKIKRVSFDFANWKNEDDAENKSAYQSGSWVLLNEYTNITYYRNSDGTVDNTVDYHSLSTVEKFNLSFSTCSPFTYDELVTETDKTVNLSENCTALTPVILVTVSDEYSNDYTYKPYVEVNILDNTAYNSKISMYVYYIENGELVFYRDNSLIGNCSFMNSTVTVDGVDKQAYYVVVSEVFPDEESENISGEYI